MNANAYFPWNEGRPTKPEVDSLVRAFPPEDMKTGWRASDDQLREIIGECDRNRFHTVCSAWQRRLENDHQVILYRAKLQGYYVPTAEEIFGRTHPAMVHIGRTARKQKLHVATAAPTNAVEKVTQEHHGRLLSGVERESRSARKELVGPSVTSALPQIVQGVRDRT